MEKNSQAGKYIALVLFAIITVFAILFLILPKAKNSRDNSNSLPTSSQNNDSRNQEELIVGGDSDEHGCKASAGYSWCDVKQKCLRIWEESCAVIDSNLEEIIRTEIKRALIEKHGENANNLTITVSDIDGNYAKGGAAELGMGGGMWFAAKVGSEWKLVWDGNGIIECTSLEDYPDFPATFISNCFDPESQTLVTR